MCSQGHLNSSVSEWELGVLQPSPSVFGINSTSLHLRVLSSFLGQGQRLGKGWVLKGAGRKELSGLLCGPSPRKTPPAPAPAPEDRLVFPFLCCRILFRRTRCRGVNWEMEAKVGLRAVRASRPQHPRVDCTPGSPGEGFTDHLTPPQPAETGFLVSLGSLHLNPDSVITPVQSTGSHRAGGQLITWYPKCQFSSTQNSLNLTASVSPHKKLGCWRA